MGLGSIVKDVFKGSGGGIVSGALGLAGGLLTSGSKADASAANLALNREQFEYQKELHRNQLQWKVEDAKKAGLHPMAALGLSGMNFSPVSAQAEGVDYNWMGDLGQNIDRAIQQGKTAAEREQAQALQDKLTDIQIRKGQADADLAETEAASARLRLQRELFPPAPVANKPVGLVDGQSDSSPDGTFGKNAHRLFNLAVHGATGMAVVNPDIADSISESMKASIAAEAIREIESGNPEVIDDLINSFPPSIRKEINAGKMRIVTVPGSGIYRAVPVGPDEAFDRYNIF